MKDMKFKRSNKGNGGSGKEGSEKAGGSQGDVARTPNSGRKDVNVSDRKSASTYLKPVKSDSGTAPSHSNEKKGVIGKWWNVLEIPCSPKKLYTKKKVKAKRREVVEEQDPQYTEAETALNAGPVEVNKDVDMKTIVAKKNDATRTGTGDLQKTMDEVKE